LRKLGRFGKVTKRKQLVSNISQASLTYDITEGFQMNFTRRCTHQGVDS